MNQDKLLGETQKGLFIGLVLTKKKKDSTIYYSDKETENRKT